MYPNLNLSIHGSARVKALRIVYRFAVADGKQRRSTVVEGRGSFVCIGREGNDSAFLSLLFFLSLCMSHDHQEDLLE